MRRLLCILFVGVVATILLGLGGCSDQSNNTTTPLENGAWFNVEFISTIDHEDCVPVAPNNWRCLGDRFINTPPYFILTSGDEKYFVRASDISWQIEEGVSSVWLLWSVVWRNAMPDFMFDKDGIIDPEAYEDWAVEIPHVVYVPTWNSTHPRWKNFRDWLDSLDDPTIWSGFLNRGVDDDYDRYCGHQRRHHD